METKFCIGCFYKCHRVTINNSYLEKGKVYKCIQADKVLACLEDDKGDCYYISQDDIRLFNKSGINPKNWTKNNEKVNNTQKVYHPDHYCNHPSGVECIDITRHYNFNIGNAIKYIWRAGLKSEKGYTDKEKEIEDIEKAIWYLQDYIDNKLLKDDTSRFSN